MIVLRNRYTAVPLGIVMMLFILHNFKVTQ